MNAWVCRCVGESEVERFCGDIIDRICSPNQNHRSFQRRWIRASLSGLAALAVCLLVQETHTHCLVGEKDLRIRTCVLEMVKWQAEPNSRGHEEDQVPAIGSQGRKWVSVAWTAQRLRARRHRKQKTKPVHASTRAEVSAVVRGTVNCIHSFFCEVGLVQWSCAC